MKADAFHAVEIEPTGLAVQDLGLQVGGKQTTAGGRPAGKRPCGHGCAPAPKRTAAQTTAPSGGGSPAGDPCDPKLDGRKAGDDRRAAACDGPRRAASRAAGGEASGDERGRRH